MVGNAALFAVKSVSTSQKLVVFFVITYYNILALQ